MKKILFICFILANSVLMGQSLLPMVVNSAGESVKNGAFSMDYSVGEAAITILENGDKKLNQGFIQPIIVVAPIADFSANTTTILVGKSVIFTDGSSNSPTSWEWTFNGGDPEKSDKQNPGPITYNTPGTYAVTLKATNSAGNNSVTKSAYIIVNANVVAPVADFSANQTNINIGQSINFTDKSNNSPTSWEWIFVGGEPEKSDVQNPTITYKIAGTYTVTLKATNSAGNNSITKSAYIIVNASVVAPVADFSASQTIVSVGDEVQFSDKSTNNPTEWAWTIEGSNFPKPTSQNPKVIYNTVGKFKVTLIAKNSAGQNSIEKADYIEVIQSALLPKPDFIADKNKIKTGDFVQFTDKSTNKPTKWLWSFPGGTPNTSDKQNPIIIYSTKGCYNVTLIAENGAGQAASSKTNFICVDDLIATSDLKLSNFVKISPNPTSSILFLDFFEKSNEAVQIEILDCNSRILKRLNTDSNSTIPIDVSDLPSQLYYLKVQMKDKVFYEKAMKE